MVTPSTNSLDMDIAHQRECSGSRPHTRPNEFGCLRNCPNKGFSEPTFDVAQNNCVCPGQGATNPRPQTTHHFSAHFKNIVGEEEWMGVTGFQ